MTTIPTTTGGDCASARRQLLASATPAHLATCAACRLFAARLRAAEAALPRLPLPGPDPANRAAFLEAAALGPIIVRRPAPVTSPSALMRAVRTAWREREAWQVGGGVALVLALGFGLYSAGTRPAGAEYVQVERHELLRKQVESLAMLAKARTPSERLEIWAGVAEQLAAEAGRVHVGATADDLASLERAFDQAVADGIERQARALAESPERAARLGAARLKLERIAADARSLLPGAPVQAQLPLNHLMQAAERGGRTLADLLQRGAD